MQTSFSLVIIWWTLMPVSTLDGCFDGCCLQIVQGLNDPHVSFIDFYPLHINSLQDLTTPGGVGCQFHPSILYHTMMAQNLTAAISANTGWT